jgi:hypothetical protein
MTEPAEISPEPDAAIYRHILDDLHELRHALAVGLDVLGDLMARAERTEELAAGAVARLAQLDEEFGPLARRYSKLLGGGVVTDYLAARKAATNGEGVQRAGEGDTRTRRARIARRKLPDARLRRGERRDYRLRPGAGIAPGRPGRPDQERKHRTPVRFSP